MGNRPAFVAIRTCDRPGHLQRQLLSISRRPPSAGPVRVLVFDDTRDEAIQQRNEQAVRSANRRFSFAAEYLGPEWQRDFSAALKAELPQHAKSIGWLLDARPAGEFTAGRLLNLITLSLAGHRFALFDDDYLLHQVRHLGFGLNRKLEWSRDPTRQVLGHSSVRESRSAGTKLDIDGVDEHFRYLGRRVKDCVRPDAAGAAPLLDASEAGEPPEALQLDQDSVILTTVSGQYGVPISPNSFYLFYQDYGGRQPVWADPEHYRVLRLGKAVWNVTYGPVIAGRTGSTPSSVDNRVIMPPTLPHCRGEDTLFCAMIKFTHANAAHLYLPWAQEHSRRPSSWVQSTFGRAQPIMVAKFFWKIVERMGDELPAGFSPEQRLQSMADYWLDWSGLPQDRLRADIVNSHLRGLAWRKRVAEKCLAMADPTHTQVCGDLSRSLAQFKQDIELPDGLPVLRDQAGIRSEAGRIRWLAGVARDYGQAMQAWPELWKVSREIQFFG